MRTSRRHPNRHLVAIAVGSLLATFGATPASAATCTWNPASGDWGTAGNWSCGSVPGATDTASIVLGQTSTVTGAQGPTNVSNAGTVSISDNSSLTLLGININSGLVNLGSFGNPTDLRISGATALNGSGVVSMSNAAANRIVAHAGALDVLNIGSGQTVQGAGQIGAGGSLGLVNGGTVVANLNAGITLNAQGGVTNNSVLRGNGATLLIQNSTVNQGAGGVLDAINAGGRVQLSGASITGGSFSTSAGGAIATVAGTNSTVSGVTNLGTLNIVDNSTLTLGGTLTNNGSVIMQSLGNPTSLTVTGAQSILGTGTINLSGNLANRILGAGATLTLGSGQTLQGAGTIGAGSAGFALVNSGTVIASQSQPLLINALGGVTNTGTMRADGGTLQLQTTVNSGGGAIEARNGSQVQLLNGAVINNANFSASGVNSLITTVGGATVTLGGGTVSGPMTIADNSSLVLAADAVYNGTLRMASLGNPTSLLIDGARSLTGTATVQMSNTPTNRISGNNASGDSLTLGSNITVQGAGTIGGNNLSLVNNGSLIANASNGITLSSGGTVTNNNVIRADGAEFAISATNVNQGASGVLDAINNGVVRLTGNSTITGGTFSTSTGGQIATLGGQTGRVSGVTNTGTLRVVDNSTLALDGTLTNNGVINMTSLGNLTDIRTTGNRLIDGTGTINLSNNSQNRIVADAAGNSLSLGSGQTLQGAGQIGAGGQLNLTNNGTIIGNLSNALTISSTGSVLNNNVVRADSGTVIISGTNLAQGPSGVIDAINSGVVRLIGGGTISGGRFTTASGGQIATLSGHTAGVNGVTNTGTLNVVDNSALLLNGNLTNNGVVAMGSVGNLTDIRTTGNRLIDGTGTINLSNNSQNRIVADAAGNSLSLGSGQTLQGAGQIGAGGQLNLTNNGTIIGNLSNALTISSSGTVTNNKTVRADSGTVTISGTNFGQGALGLIEAINAGVVNVNGGSTISGGTFSTTGTGQVRTNVADVATISNVTNNGDFNVVDNSTLILSGTVTNNGTLDLNSVGNLTKLRVSGFVTLAGTGTTTLGNNTQNRILAETAGTHQLTNAAGHTIQGSGLFGDGSAMSIVNQGTITANQGTLLTIRVAAGQTVENQLGGLMQATGGRTLNLRSVVANSGTLAANGGEVNAGEGFTGAGVASISGTGQLVVGAASTVGTLVHNGSATNGLSLGTNHITVSGDYTNANWGTGNSFNRRANVAAGAGQIRAAADAAQAITGTGVTNGATTNATLTIGNVRVGNNTFNYQIANTGTTGPTLRGAIQTTVGGGNISDGRLSGAGVTPGNYNTGAPGNNTGDLAVVFNAAAAGSLAPLSGQVLNLRSNFENILDQKLNIVLAGGAAAYNAAVGSAAPNPVQVANQRVGGTNTAALTIANTAPTGAFTEVLNASFGANGGLATSTGSISGGLGSGGVAVGTPNNTSMRVGVDATAAGARSGTVTVNFSSNGTGTSGLGTIGAGSSSPITVNGNVYQAAQAAPSTLPGTINLGNFHAGSGAQSAPGIVITNTNLAPAGFQEGLAAAIVSTSGQATGTGFTNAVAGGNGTLNVGLAGINAGNNTGTVNVQLRSNGISTTGDTGLGNLDLGAAQAITVNATGYRLAQANTIAPVAFGNVLINSTQERFLTISNTALADSFSEALNAAFGTKGGIDPGRFTTSGSITGLLAGAPADSTSMKVTLNTSSTGAVSANVQILLTSNGDAVGNGLGLTPLTTQTINLGGTITGVVGTLASASLTPTNVNFGKFREGAPNQTQVLTIGNVATAPAEGLNASFGTSNGVTNNGGTITSLAPGPTTNTSLSVTLGGLATAGAKSGTQVVNFVSDGSFNNGVTTPLDPQTVTLNAEVYRLAQANVTPTINLAARRVGDAGSTGTIAIANSAANDGFSESLDGTLSAAPSGFIVAGPSATGLIAAGASATRTVTLDTGTAGVFGGNVTVALVSNGAGTSGFGDFPLTEKSTTLNGKVYTPAVGQTPTATLDFGVVRVGDTPSAKNIVINNSAATTALNDTLRADLGGVSGPFTGNGGSAAGIAAQGSGAIAVGLETTAAGVFSQNGTVSFLSQNGDMGDVSAGPNANVAIKAQVNSLANADFDWLSGVGVLSQNGTKYELDLGTVTLGTSLSALLQLDNDVAGPADDLSGGFDLSGADDFTLSGWNAFGGPTALAAGQAKGGLELNWLAAALGFYTDSIVFNGLGTNASDLQGLAQARTLLIKANVVQGGTQVPEPSTFALLMAAFAAGWAVRLQTRVGSKGRRVATRH